MGVIHTGRDIRPYGEVQIQMNRICKTTAKKKPSVKIKLSADLRTAVITDIKDINKLMRNCHRWSFELFDRIIATGLDNKFFNIKHQNGTQGEFIPTQEEKAMIISIVL